VPATVGLSVTASVLEDRLAHEQEESVESKGGIDLRGMFDSLKKVIGETESKGGMDLGGMFDSLNKNSDSTEEGIGLARSMDGFKKIIERNT